MPGPAATIGSMHVCPMLNPGTPPPPHVGGPVSGPGVPTVLIGGKPAAVMGDMCTCAGPPDTIIKGCATVLIGGKPAATVGDMTAHGGSITVGEPTVLIGTGASQPSAIMPIKKIPFPKISSALRTMASVTGRGKQLKEAIASQNTVKKEAENNEGEPQIYGIEWVVGEERINSSRLFQEVKVTANVLNIPDGESISFEIKRPLNENNEDEDVITLNGTVNNKKVEVTWEVEKNPEHSINNES